VIAPANTGSDNNNNIAVISTAQTNKESLSDTKPVTRIFAIVHIKLIAPNNEDIPAKCKLKIARSTDDPECPLIDDNGGYIVHPVPAPTSTKDDSINRNRDAGNNQKLMLFNLGNAISGAPIIRGTNQLPYPPISAGITRKNIISNACAVTITLYN
jgi:hypothetical protein